MILTLPYPPSANSLTLTIQRKGRPPIRVPSPEAKQYRAAASKAAALQGAKVSHGPVGVRVTVFRPRKSGDLDNTLKALLDCLKGLCWEDDSQVVKIIAERRDDPSNPRAELEVVPLSGASADLFSEW